MGKQVQVTLDSLDWGQAVDGLRLREEAWRQTADFLRTGEQPSGVDFFSPEECHKPEEAEAIADHYQSIVEKIERQIADQRVPAR